jgi:hypothetical protein
LNRCLLVGPFGPPGGRRKFPRWACVAWFFSGRPVAGVEKSSGRYVTRRKAITAHSWGQHPADRRPDSHSSERRLRANRDAFVTIGAVRNRLDSFWSCDSAD